MAGAHKITVPTSDSDDHSDGSDAGLSTSRVSRGQIGLIVVTILSCIAVGIVIGRASTLSSSSPLLSSAQIATDSPVRFYRTHSDRTLKMKTPKKNVTADQYLTVLVTQLALINATKETIDNGVPGGLAPWQLAVAGDKSDKGDFCEKGDATASCSSDLANPSWKKFDGGVWALSIDPELELESDEQYEDEEIIETRFQVTLTNNLSEPTLMHFHGLVPPNNLDGIPWISANPIQPNHTVFYDFMVYHRGTYWMHSHFSHHAGSGLLAPIIIQDHPRFLKELGDPQDVLMVIMDAHWRALCAYERHLYPDECPLGGFDGWDQYTFNVNGRSLQNGAGGMNEVIVSKDKPVRLRVLDAGTMAYYRVHLGGLEGEVISTDGRRVKRKGHKVQNFSIASANRLDVLLNITHDGCFTIMAQRMMLSNSYDDSKDNVNDKEAERAGLILKTAGQTCNHTVNATKKDIPKVNIHEWTDFYEGLEAMNGLKDPHKPADVSYTVELTGAFDDSSGEWRPAFSINDKPHHLWPFRVWCKTPEGEDHDIENAVLTLKFCQGEHKISNVQCDRWKCPDPCEETPNPDGRCGPKDKHGIPIKGWKDEWEGIHVSECGKWNIRPQSYTYNKEALEVCHGDRVWITYKNSGTEEGHPMHLHGTHQQLIKVDGKDFGDKAAGGAGPFQDTWFMMRGQNITVAFDALNPGEWLMHCHIEHHMMNGMLTTVRYVNDDKCRERRKEKPDWTWTAPVNTSEWPHDWFTLWNHSLNSSTIKVAV